MSQTNQTSGIQGSGATCSEEKSRTFYTSKGSRTVVTYVQDGSFNSRLWVNCVGEQLGSATLTARDHKSEKGARKWAAEVLAR